ncbi:MAG: hypothetical protein GY810_31405 [Aureispira sp.]|nr:hypothetical protein [Aureispira sp.]
MNYDQKSQELEELMNLSKSYMDVCKQNKLMKDATVKAQFKKMQTLFKVAKKAQKQLMKLEKMDDKIEDVIHNSSLPQKIKNHLLLLVDDLADSKEVLVGTKKAVKAIDKFYKDHDGEDGVSKHDLIGIVLQVLNKKQLSIAKDDLETAFDNYQDGSLVIEQPRAKGTGAKIKYVPFAKYIKDLQEKVFFKGILSKDGILKTMKIGKFELPIRIKASTQVSGDFAFNAPALTKGTANDEDTIFNVTSGALRQTSAFSGGLSSMKSALTLGSAGFGIDVGAMQFVFKVDAAKWAVAAENPADIKFEPLACSAQVQLTPEHLNWWMINVFGDEFPLAVPKCSKLAMSIKFTFTVDMAEYAKIQAVNKIEDKVERAVIEELKKNADRAVEYADDLAKHYADEASQEAKEAAAKALKNNLDKSARMAQKRLHSKAAKEMAEKIVTKSANQVVSRLTAKLGAKIVMKFIPGLNVISTVYDAVQLGIVIYDYFKAKPLTPEQIAENEARARKTAADKKAKEDKASRNPKNRDYVILKAFSGVPDTDSMYPCGMFYRYDAYVTFYSNSKTYKHYQENKGQYKGRVLKEGKESIGSAITVGYDVHKEYMQEAEAIRYKKSNDQGMQLSCADRLNDIDGYAEMSRMIGKEVSGELFNRGDRVPN